MQTIMRKENEKADHQHSAANLLGGKVEKSTKAGTAKGEHATVEKVDHDVL